MFIVNVCEELIDAMSIWNWSPASDAQPFGSALAGSTRFHTVLIPSIVMESKYMHGSPLQSFLSPITRWSTT
jgi:RES domain-containing protein